MEFTVETGEVILWKRNLSAVATFSVPDKKSLGAVFSSDFQHGGGMFRSHDNTKTESHVVAEKHLIIADAAVALNQTKDRVRLWKIVDDVAHIGICAAEVEKTATGDVSKCFDVQLTFEHCQNFSHINTGWFQQ